MKVEVDVQLLRDAERAIDMQVSYPKHTGWDESEQTRDRLRKVIAEAEERAARERDQEIKAALAGIKAKLDVCEHALSRPSSEWPFPFSEQKFRENVLAEIRDLVSEVLGDDPLRYVKGVPGGTPTATQINIQEGGRLR